MDAGNKGCPQTTATSHIIDSSLRKQGAHRSTGVIVFPPKDTQIVTYSILALTWLCVCTSVFNLSVCRHVCS